MESVIKSAAMLDGSRPRIGPPLMNLSSYSPGSNP